ncbi:hypothetical protein BU17DRAFT_97379 [Hysterangium stoloniferum]|nr:hypothetical protein BU17DRAFT_97379 [Hysterangium stoloniferum]
MQLSMAWSKQDARFKILCDALLDVALDATVSARSLVQDNIYEVLDSRVDVMGAYFADGVMLRNSTDKINHIASCLVFHLRHVLRTPLKIHILTSPSPSSHISVPFDPWTVLTSLADTIKILMKLIAASPDPECACTEIRAENAVNAFVELISHLDVLDLRRVSDYSEDFSHLETASHSLLLLIATPFTGRSVLCNSHCMSLLEKNGWSKNAVSAYN